MIRSIQTLVYRWRIILHDMMLTPMAWVGAYWLRFNLETVPDIFMHSAIAALPVVIAVQVVINAVSYTHLTLPTSYAV